MLSTKVAPNSSFVVSIPDSKKFSQWVFKCWQNWCVTLLIYTNPPLSTLPIHSSDSSASSLLYLYCLLQKLVSIFRLGIVQRIHLRTVAHFPLHSSSLFIYLWHPTHIIIFLHQPLLFYKFVKYLIRYILIKGRGSGNIFSVWRNFFSTCAWMLCQYIDGEIVSTSFPRLFSVNPLMYSRYCQECAQVLQPANSHTVESEWSQIPCKSWAIICISRKLKAAIRANHKLADFLKCKI